MNQEYLPIFLKYGFNFGRCVGSKSRYHDNHKEDLVVFNARIYLKSTYTKELEEIKDWFKGQEHEIWYGDLNLSKDLLNLYKVWMDIKEPIIITYESGQKVIEIGRYYKQLGD